VPSVSVVIPAYNHARYLDKRLSSIVQQTFDDYEMIILDDCSTDDSRAVIENYSQTRNVRTLFNTVNSGNPFIQWNRGVGLSTGDFVWIAESDDFADQYFLETAVKVLESHHNLGLIYCQSYKVDADNLVTGTMLDWTADLIERQWTEDFMNRGVDEVRRFLSFKNTVPNASAVLFRRSIYERVNGADSSFRVCGDWMLWIKMLLLSDVAFISTPLNYFRQHSETVRNSTSRSGDMIKETYAVAGFIQDRVGFPEDIFDSVSRQHLNVWHYCMRSTDAALVSKQMREIYKSAQSFDKRIGKQELGEIYLDLANFHRVNEPRWARRFLLRALASNPRYLRDRNFASLALETFL